MNTALILLLEGLKMNQNGIVDKNSIISKSGVPIAQHLGPRFQRARVV